MHEVICPAGASDTTLILHKAVTSTRTIRPSSAETLFNIGSLTFKEQAGAELRHQLNAYPGRGHPHPNR